MVEEILFWYNNCNNLLNPCSILRKAWLVIVNTGVFIVIVHLKGKQKYVEMLRLTCHWLRCTLLSLQSLLHLLLHTRWKHSRLLITSLGGTWRPRKTILERRWSGTRWIERSLSLCLQEWTSTVVVVGTLNYKSKPDFDLKTFKIKKCFEK